jgi:hypothetical protein
MIRPEKNYETFIKELENLTSERTNVSRFCYSFVNSFNLQNLAS